MPLQDEQDEVKVSRCEVRLLDEDGLVEVVHNLGTMDVHVVLHAKDGTILTPRMMTSIDPDTCEGILSEEPAYAMVTRAEDVPEPEKPRLATSKDHVVTIKQETGIRTGPMG